jgi:hypothetical protein
MILDQLLTKLSYATIPLFWPLWLAVVIALVFTATSTQSNWRSLVAKGCGLGVNFSRALRLIHALGSGVCLSRQ